MRLVRFLRAYPGLAIVVFAPTVLAALYYAFVASDIYVSETQYVVRNTSEPSATSGFASFLQSAGLGNASSDSYTVAAYLGSRDALASLERSTDIRALYDRPEAKHDFIARFPNLLYRDSFENLFIHYGYWTQIDYNTESGISTLSAFAFRAQDAQLIAGNLLELSERLVNELNARVRSDSLGAARREVEHLQQQGVDVQKQITDFRFRELMIDPNAASTAALSRLASIESDLVSTRSLLSQIERSAPQSPQVQSLQSRITSLQQQLISEERRGSGGAESLAPKMAEYEQLLQRQQFVQLMQQTAVAALESAEISVQQQQIYIERVSAPSLPDRAMYPYRLLDLLLVSITCLLIYGIGRLMIGAIREHLAP